MTFPQPPPDDATPLDWLLFEQSGVLTHRQAVTHLSRGQVRGRVRSGRWRILARGVLLAGNGTLTRPQQLWTAVLAAGAGAVLAGATAAAESGVRGLRAEPLYLLVPANRHRSRRLPRLPLDMAGVALRRSAVLPPEHLQLGRPIRTSLPRAIVDAAAWARTDDEACTLVAAACQQRKVTPAELRAVIGSLPRLRRRALTLETITDVAGGAEALSEINFVRLCRRFGLPPPDLQEPRLDRSSRRRFLDAYWRKWGLIVEVDGAHHMEVRQWEADLRRQNDLWIAGERILRFTSYQVRHRPAEVAAQIRRALLAAGWLPG